MVDPENGSPPLSLSPAEAPLIESLKLKLADQTLATLDFARALRAHLSLYRQSYRALAQKLGIANRHSMLSETVDLLDLPPLVIKELEGKRFNVTAVRNLLVQHKPLDVKQPIKQKPEQVAQGPEQQQEQPEQVPEQPEQPPEQPEQREQSPEQDPEQQINGPERVYLPINANKASFPLLKETVNSLTRFWSKEAHWGELAEKWAIRLSSYGWLKSFLAFVAIVFIPLGALKAVDLVRTWVSLSPRLPFSDSSRQPFTAPRLSNPRMISGNRLELRRDPIAAATQYRIYWNSGDGKHVDRLGEVVTPGTIVAISRYREAGFISVTAIGADQEETRHSQLVRITPNPQNDLDRIEPLSNDRVAVDQNGGRPEQRLTGEAAKGSSIKNTTRRPTVLTPPVEVHADVRSPDRIRLSWRAVGKDFRYNVYSSATSTLIALRKENLQPLKSNLVEWTPETGLKRYWIVVTTLDAQDRESAYSEAIEVIRYPGKSGDDAADKAEGVLRKVLPW